MMPVLDPSYVASALLGLITGVLTWLPVSPNGQLMDLLTGLGGWPAPVSTVPAYLGVMMAPVFLYWTDIAREATVALRGRFQASHRFYFYAGIFTLMVGYPIASRGFSLSPQTADLLSVGIGGLIILAGVLRRESCEDSDRSTLLGAIFAGSAQGISFIGGIPRTGLTFPALLAAGFDAERSLRRSFLLAPLFFLMKLLFTDTGGLGGTGQSLVMFTFAFFSSMAVMKILLVLAGRLDRKRFACLYGGIAILAYIMGVIM